MMELGVQIPGPWSKTQALNPKLCSLSRYCVVQPRSSHTLAQNCLSSYRSACTVMCWDVLPQPCTAPSPPGHGFLINISYSWGVSRTWRGSSQSFFLRTVIILIQNHLNGKVSCFQNIVIATYLVPNLLIFFLPWHPSDSVNVGTE